MATMKCVYVLACLITLTASTPLWLRPQSKTLHQNKAEADPTYQLSGDVVPNSYVIELIPYFEEPVGKNFTFDGTVTINVKVDQATRVIQMHVFDINIISIIIYNETQTPIVITDYSFDDKDDHQFLHINTPEELIPGDEFDIVIKYTGILNNDLDGFYRSKYMDAENKEKYMLITQFEQTGARRAFPCFDEPLYKAIFTIWIAHDAVHPTVLSNMPVESDIDPVEGMPGWTWTKFRKSPVVMSTYLVAFSVSDFTSLVHPDDPTYQLWARNDLAQSQGHYANNLAPKIVDYMEKYTGHQYSLPKIDQVAIPDFSAGAMENWGLITYRESRLLFEEGVSTTNDRQRIETVVAHELAHQWFGNIVSPTWWSHIWLNEGFATYFEYHALATIQDTWQLEEQFVYQEMHAVLLTDALNSTHPMNSVVDTPASSSAAFDNIAYNKGGCIVRYMVYLLGEEVFKDGINNYLTKMEFGNAEPKDLWTAIGEKIDPAVLPSGKTFADVMSPWDLQPGYPVITVTRDYTDPQKAKITQERFMTQRDGSATYDEKWWIALTMTSEINPDFETMTNVFWMDPEVDTLDLSLPSVTNDQWILFNIKEIGYYRVNYDQKNWELLIAAQHTLHPINRGQLMDDALALARVSYVEYPTALDTTDYLSMETEYMPWAVGLTSTSYIWDRLNYESYTRDLFQRFMLSKMDLIYDLVNGFTLTDDDSHIMNQKRTLILKWACEYGHEECSTEAVALFKDWQSKTNPDTENPIAPDLKSVVYCAGIRAGGKKEFNFLSERYDNAYNNAGEQSLILTALGCSTDLELLDKYLTESIAENSRIRTQDARSVHTAVYSNYLGVDLALDFIIKNWERCVEVYQGSNNVGRAFTGVSTKCNTVDQEIKLEALYNEHADPSTSTMDRTLHAAIGSSIKTVEESVAWHASYSETVTSYLLDKVGPASGASSIVAFPSVVVALLISLLLRL